MVVYGVMSQKADHPEKIVSDAIEMYQSRLTIAMEQRRQFRKGVGVFVIMEPDQTRIVPDMTVKVLDQHELIAYVDTNHESVRSAIGMMQRMADEEGDGEDDHAVYIPFGVVFPDRGLIVSLLHTKMRT